MKLIKYEKWKNESKTLSRVIEAVKSNIESQNGEVASMALAELISKMGSKQPVDGEALRVYVDSGIIDILSKMLAQSDDAKVSAGNNLWFCTPELHRFTGPKSWPSLAEESCCFSIFITAHVLDRNGNCTR